MKKLLITLLISANLHAECDVQLTKCSAYVDGLVTENSLLQDKINILVKQRDEAIENWKRAEDPSIATPVLWLTLGLSAGLVVSRLLK